MVKADRYGDPNWLGSRFRLRRLGLLTDIIDQIIAQKGHCRIADVGGTAKYWRLAPSLLADRPVAIDLLNLREDEPVQPPFRFIRADACQLAFVADGSYDLAHSNSVIEHVGDRRAMQQMASEIRRIAVRYFVQTPSFWFPIEPHFRFLGFHWLPRDVRMQLIRWRDLGYMPRARDRAEAAARVDSARLLARPAFQQLFPDAAIREEKFFGLTKSFMAIR